MPIYVQVPGGKMDTAGRGAAAAQQFRQNEHQMDVVDERTRNEVDLATRKLDIEERQIDFQQEQLAQQQAAAGDLLVAQARMKGPMSPQQERAMRMLSPEAQERLLYANAQNERVQGEAAKLQQGFAELDTLEKNEFLSDKVAQLRVEFDSGGMSAQQAMTAIAKLKREAATIDHQQKTYEVVQGNLEAWVDPKANPDYDMPDEGDDARDDVMELYEKLSPNAQFDPGLKYDKLFDQYKFLTTRGMREASRVLLEADFKKHNVRAVNADELDALLESASENPEFVQRAQKLRNVAADLVDRATPWMPKGGGTAGASGSTSTSGAPKASAPAGETVPAEEASGSAADLSAASVMGGGVTEEQDRWANQALKNLGMDEVPPKGSRARVAFVDEIRRLMAEEPEDLGAMVKKGQSQRRGLTEIIGEGVKAGVKAITPSESARRQQVSTNKRNRGVR
jgi:hypothetical protein